MKSIIATQQKPLHVKLKDLPVLKDCLLELGRFMHNDLYTRREEIHGLIEKHRTLFTEKLASKIPPEVDFLFQKIAKQTASNSSPAFQLIDRQHRSDIVTYLCWKYASPETGKKNPFSFAKMKAVFNDPDFVPQEALQPLVIPWTCSSCGDEQSIKVHNHAHQPKLSFDCTNCGHYDKIGYTREKDYGACTQAKCTCTRCCERRENLWSALQLNASKLAPEILEAYSRAIEEAVDANLAKRQATTASTYPRPIRQDIIREMQRRFPETIQDLIDMSDCIREEYRHSDINIWASYFPRTIAHELIDGGKINIVANYPDTPDPSKLAAQVMLSMVRGLAFYSNRPGPSLAPGFCGTETYNHETALSIMTEDPEDSDRMHEVGDSLIHVLPELLYLISNDRPDEFFAKFELNKLYLDRKANIYIAYGEHEGFFNLNNRLLENRSIVFPCEVEVVKVGQDNLTQVPESLLGSTEELLNDFLAAPETTDALRQRCQALLNEIKSA